RRGGRESAVVPYAADLGVGNTLRIEVGREGDAPGPTLQGEGVAHLLAAHRLRDSRGQRQVAQRLEAEADVAAESAAARLVVVGDLLQRIGVPAHACAEEQRRGQAQVILEI